MMTSFNTYQTDEKGLNIRNFLHLYAYPREGTSKGWSWSRYKRWIIRRVGSIKSLIIKVYKVKLKPKSNIEYIGSNAPEEYKPYFMVGDVPTPCGCFILTLWIDFQAIGKEDKVVNPSQGKVTQ